MGTGSSMCNVPITLPDEWSAEWSDIYNGIIITAATDGYVTVNEQLRNFGLGICLVKSPGDYHGRGWKQRLYEDAVNALQDAII